MTCTRIQALSTRSKSNMRTWLWIMTAKWIERQAIRALVAYELPDGQIITIDRERFQCGEALFKPDLMHMHPGREAFGVHDMAMKSIAACPMDCRREMYGNIILSGGTTRLPGFAERLKKELESSAASTLAVNVVAPPERKYSVWIGGSIFASLPTLADHYITKAQ
eukprot:TRINITY_DN12654_c2_g6_i1.p2 TRINITY_DN12654_c2_g6~~TRINITY_DN12654_c2_g6_i1.p2  ORF type:complete len:166 (+),score=33.77 TRINITY_DN12654_c2_g6_i1:874-1371(+)